MVSIRNAILVVIGCAVTAASLASFHAARSSVAELHRSLEAIDNRTRKIDTELSDASREVRLLSPYDLGNRRIEVRLFMIKSHLAQADRPIVFIGDSITEGALLPSTICGRPVVNAGIGGISAASHAAYHKVARELFVSLNADLIVIALGTNDAAKHVRYDIRRDYEDLLQMARQHAPKIIAVGIPPIQNGGLTAYFDPNAAANIDRMIRDLAHENGAEFADVRSAITSDDATIDGVHLKPAGYKPWITTIEHAIARSLPCDALTLAQ
ncbi:SGNH/GDSL hydrolase family protein [Bradyrhizobium sp. SZCCHNS3002]|uniref:SGNH/GDSL hydrolase family protein n=1 Tax=Bradyrhizobium sp. SZCCHNS3002 TaxID=3057310 RepID=UPI0028E492DD|nr:GDSL-type esterase/lipase family protein [Bradyrhizobium sp. SZCCHNS3002]